MFTSAILHPLRLNLSCREEVDCICAIGIPPLGDVVIIPLFTPSKKTRMETISPMTVHMESLSD